jgi:hypothetical protein
MNKRKSFSPKYVNVFTNHISTWVSQMKAVKLR